MPDKSEAAPSPARKECLSEQEVARVQAAPPGEVPEDLARHLAGCERCQERALFGPNPRARRRRVPRMPSPARAIILLAIMAAVIVAFLITLERLVGRP